MAGVLPRQEIGVAFLGAAFQAKEAVTYMFT